MAMSPIRQGDAIEPTPEMYEEAAGWILRLRESADEGELTRFREWQAATPARQFAVAEMEVLLEGARPVAAAMTGEARLVKAKRWRWAGAGIAAALALTALGLGAREEIRVRLEADAAAAAGVRREVVLPDGTKVELNSRSAIARRFSSGRRGVTLLRGEAFFDVAKNPARPFVIVAGAARVTVVGTRFNVRLSEDETVVTVEEGIVRLAPRSAPGKGLLLAAGQQAFVEGDRAQAQPSFDRFAASAWRRGQMVFYDTRLDRVTAELNRYRRGPILVANPALASERISGVFSTRDTDDALKSLEKRLDADSLPLPGGAAILY